MATSVVFVAVMATGPSVAAAERPVAAGLSGPPVQGPTSPPGSGGSRHPRHAGPGQAPSPQALSAVLADELGPVLGTDPGRLAVGVVDLSSGTAATYNGGTVIRGGGIVTTDILAALLLQHQQARTQLSNQEAELAADMIENDSTTAANQLWTLLGGAPGLAAANATLKLRNTSLTPGADWTWTKTTVADQLQLLADIAAPHSPLDAASRDYVLGLMTSVTVSQSWGALAAATPGTLGAVANGSVLGPRWVIGSIGVIDRNGHELLVAVLSDRNPAQGPAISLAQAAVRAAVKTVS